MWLKIITTSCRCKAKHFLNLDTGTRYHSIYTSLAFIHDKNMPTVDVLEIKQDRQRVVSGVTVAKKIQTTKTEP